MSRTIEDALKLLQQWDYYADNSEPALTNQRKLALKEIETLLLDWFTYPPKHRTKANLLKILGGKQ